MRRFEACRFGGGRLSSLPSAFLLSGVCFWLLALPSLAFCASWEPIGPDGGSFIFSVTNPANANEVTAITTSPSPSYVWRSTDAGTTWTKIGEIPYSYISDVSAFDFSTLYAISSSRCYRSTDGGATWTESRLPSNAGWAYNVCVDPTDGSKVYAAGYEYISSDQIERLAFFKSTDGGLSWSASSCFNFDYFGPQDMAISKSNPNVIYVAGYKAVGLYSYGALLKSSDAGNTWTDISSSVDSERYNYFYAVAVDPTDADKVYVGGSYFYRTARTPRGTELTWTRSPTPLFIYTIGIDPVEPSRIYIGGYQSVGVSTDYGQSWTLHPNCVKSAAMHVQAAFANPSTVYVSTYAGFYKSPDLGTTWTPAHQGIRAAMIPALAVAPSTVLIQSNSYLMAHNRDADGAWQYVVTPESCGVVCDILINPSDPDIVLILEDYG
jgi:photosystem II stability/assembly factor-like uncharacterized protein